MPRKLTDERSGSCKLASPAAPLGCAKAAEAFSMRMLSAATKNFAGLLRGMNDSRRKTASQVCI